MMVLVIACLARSASAALTDLPPPSERDYLLPPTEQAAASALVSAAVPDGTLVDYVSFSNGRHYSLRQFTGKHVAVLIGEADLNAYTAPRMPEAVDHLDRIYSHLAEVTGIEPAGSGPLPIAFVDLEPNVYGRGWLGAKGVELRTGLLSSTQDLALSTAVIHELCHNFDRFSDVIFYGNDPAHSWTNFLITFVQYYDREGFYRQAPDALLRSQSAWLLHYYLDAPDYSWEKCIRDNACGLDGRMGEITLPGLVERIAEIHGPEAVKRTLRFVTGARGARTFATDLQKNDLLIESLSQGAGSDLSCFFDDLRWPISPALRGSLATRLGANSRCLDSDGDGATPYQGDCMDTSAAVGPGATEVRNGTDDDCSRVVDDVLVTEKADFSDGASDEIGSFPFQVTGSISRRGDIDNLVFDLPSPASIEAEFDIGTAFELNGYAYLYGTDTSATADLAHPATIAVDDGQVHLSIRGTENGAIGTYRVSVHRAPEPYPLVVSTPPAQAGQNGFLLLASPPAPTTDRVRDSDDLKVRFWVEGLGWVGTVPVVGASPAFLDWHPPAGLDLSNRTYRVQFLDGEDPVSPASTARVLTDRASPGTCRPSNTNLCLQGGRFKVEVGWSDFQGSGGMASTATAKTNDSGLFWFYGQNNWEILVKVLDGCGQSGNGRFWVFAAASTTLEFALTVTDMQTGLVRQYTNPLAMPAATITDTEAFDTCNSSSASVSDPPGTLGSDTPDLGETTARWAADDDASAAAPAEPDVAAAAAACTRTATDLCLQGGRFRVRVNWEDFQGTGGAAGIASAGTPDSGLYYFYGPNNWEILVKVLDGCGANGNGHYWVFAAAATTLKFDLEVTDTVTGQARTYSNALGHPAETITDTLAFDACP